MRADLRSGRASNRLRDYALAVLLVAGATWVELIAFRSSFLTPSATSIGLAAALLVWIVAFAEYAHRRRRHDTALRKAAEEAAVQANRITQLTAALSHARTRRAAIEASVQEPLHALAADAGMLLFINDDGSPGHIARAVGYDDWDDNQHGRRDRMGTVHDAVGRGAPVFVEGAPARAAVPLMVGSRVIAVVQLEFRSARRFDEDDREYLEVLARRAAQALDRTSEFESALQARVEADALRARADEELARRQAMEAQLRASEVRYRTLAARTARLHGLAAALSESATPDAVARAVVQHGRNVLGAAGGEVLLLGESGFQVLYSDVPGDGNAATHLPSEPGFCPTEAVQTREPVFVSSFDEWQERYPRSASVAADGGFVSSATLPLLVDGAPIGVLAFHFTAPVNFDDDYRALLRSVGQHCAQAIERARLYDAAQRARGEAEHANRLKDKFVSIVSHELRTPLNAILGWTELLHRRWNEPAMLERGLQSIHDNTTRQARLVEDLLDFSRLQSGRLALELENVDLRALLRGVVETIVPTAAAQQLHFDVDPIPPLVVRGDPRRLEQVFLNLLGNAVKFTPEGGRVALEVRPANASVEIRISDTGEGIDPAFLPYMFDAFRQADSSQRHQGVGLGLAIAKELIDAHRGQLEAVSAGPGQGATFVVRLPTAEAVQWAPGVH